MVNGGCYIGIDGSVRELPEGYVLYGTIFSEQSLKLPDSDLEGVHVSVGTEVYSNPENPEKVY